MDVSEAIKKRRSIRKFDKKKKVSEKQIEKLLEAANWAPSAGNFQSFFIYVVKKQEVKDELMGTTNGQKHVAEASVVFVFCADSKQASYYGERGRSLYSIQDATIACMNVWLTLTEMGLGAVWVGAIDEEKVSKTLKLPEHHRPVAMLPIGYPSNTPKPPKRRGVQELSKRI